MAATDAVSSKWAELNLKFKDQIGVNDLWIAACAMSQQPALPVASHDRGITRIGSQLGITVVRQDEG